MKTKASHLCGINLGKRLWARKSREYCQSIPMGKERKDPKTANLKPCLVNSKGATNRYITSNLYCSAKRAESDRWCDEGDGRVEMYCNGCSAKVPWLLIIKFPQRHIAHWISLGVWRDHLISTRVHFLNKHTLNCVPFAFVWTDIPYE